jgi:hypothetical protein
VNFSDDAPPLRKLNGVFNFNARERIIGITPFEESLIELKNLPSVAKKIDTKISLVQVSLNS